MDSGTDVSTREVGLIKTQHTYLTSPAIMPCAVTSGPSFTAGQEQLWMLSAADAEKLQLCVRVTNSEKVYGDAMRPAAVQSRCKPNICSLSWSVAANQPDEVVAFPLSHLLRAF